MANKMVEEAANFLYSGGSGEIKELLIAALVKKSLLNHYTSRML